MFLLLMLTWLSNSISVLSGPLPPPVNVIRKSNHFQHVLLWDKGVGAPPGVTYTVTFKTDSTPCCEPVVGCERVVDPLVCNLTRAFSDPEETYHTMVTALLDSEKSSTLSPDFHPIRDTELDTPMLLVSPCNSSVCVDMDAPLSHLRSIYDSFVYELRGESVKTQHVKRKTSRSLQRIVFEDIPAGSLYCVSVRFSDSIVPRKSNFSAPKCVYSHSTLPGESLLVTLLCVAVLCLLVVFILLCFTGFICLTRQPLPSVLTSVHHLEEVLVDSCYPYVSSVLSINQVTPPKGQTENCSSETDSSEDEDEENSAERGTANTAQYATNGSFCFSLEKGHSTNQYAPSTEGLKSTEIRQEEPEEVNLLTLTFGRNEEEELESPVLLSEIEPIVCDLTDKDKECDEESEMEYNEQSGYMSR